MSRNRLPKGRVFICAVKDTGSRIVFRRSVEIAKLIWTDTGVVDGRPPDHHEHESKTAIVYYLVTPGFKLADGTFVGYLVQTSSYRVIGDGIMSLAEAKALAQADRDGS